MIISRTPVRITLGGGGTDLPSYANRFGGMVLSAAINKYVYIIVKKHFEDTIRFSGYHHKEVANSYDEIKHPVVREVAKMLDIGTGIEIVSLSDVPANVGLGTSSSFTVGLLAALHTYKGEIFAYKHLANEAYIIERIKLKEAGGVQDQYIAAFGGTKIITIRIDGEVELQDLNVPHIEELEQRLVFFYTNIQRNASDIQDNHIRAIADNDIVDNLHSIKAIGLQSKIALEEGSLDSFGRLLHEHWKFKHSIKRGISTTQIDIWYQMAIDAGAYGGKLIGAGGGGFLMFYCPNGKDRVREKLTREGLKEISFRFEPTGSRIIMHI